MRRPLSSVITVFAIAVGPFLCLLAIGLIIFRLFYGTVTGNSTPSLEIIFPIGVVGFFTLVAGTLRPVRKVSVDDEDLYISNYLKEVSVPLSQILNVTDSGWATGHRISIYLRSPSEFGQKIDFLPRHSRIGLFPGHPVVRELFRLAHLNKPSRRNWEDEKED
ncbi:hypothetical protein BH10ACI2_BH10ACI2_25770 [soil metagenome]